MASYSSTSFVSPVPTFNRACASTLAKCSTRAHLRRATASDDSPADPSTITSGDSEKEELAAKLAAAEAEAEALRKELSARRAGKDADISKLKPATPEKRIDGSGYRETLFSVQGTTKPGSTLQQQFNKWGLSETELFLSKGAPTEGAGLGVPAAEDGSDEIVRRRLLIGCGLALAAGGVAFIKFPTGRPSKPLFFYLTSILRLRQELQFIESSSSDVQFVSEQLKRVSASPDVVKDDFLSAAAWLDGADAERATSLAYNIFDYLNQADYKNYFDNLAESTSTQQAEFLKFSLESIKAARQIVDEFVQLLPPESVEAARAQVTRAGSGLG